MSSSRCVSSIGLNAGAYIVEFIGTLFLCLTIILNSQNNYAPLAIGAVLMVMVFAGGHVSGAHYNPAVTFGVLIRGKITLEDAIVYVISQLAGGIAGVFIAMGITDNCADIAIGTNYTLLNAMLAEVIYTFALVFVILNVATTESQTGNSFFGLAIGFTVLAGAFSVGHISGGAFNPAVGTSLSFMGAMCGEGKGLSHIWLYWVGSL